MANSDGSQGDLHVSSRLLDGRYRILRQLGAGGFGEVYVAEHVNLGRMEALKTLHPSLWADRESILRFRREARAMNRLSHPNIVSIYDFGRLKDGRFFLSMELVEGEPLVSVLHRGGAMPVARVLRVLDQLASAVDHAHAHGVIHRDLKPANLVLLDPDDTLKVLDFGFAKIVAADYREASSLTGKGEVFGTFEYISPEQCVGIGDDPRSDIYAIGCIAYEMLTGQPPFAGKTVDLMHAHTTEPPAPPSGRRSVGPIPGHLEEVVMRCLEKSPQDRFPSAQDLLKALLRIPRAYFAGAVMPAPPSGEDEAVRDEETDVVRRRAALLRQLAEILLDLGQQELSLVLGIADLRELEEELGGLWATTRAIELAARVFERRIRERQRALRSALAEIRFNAVAAEQRGARSLEADVVVENLERRISELNRHLADEQGAFTDRLVDLAAARATAEEKLDDVEQRIEPLVQRLAERRRDNSTIARLLDELAASVPHRDE